MDLGFAVNKVKKEEKSKPAPFEKQNPKGAAPRSAHVINLVATRRLE